MKIIKAIFTKLMFKSILHIITKKNNDEEFPKEINQNNHHGTIFAFFPFFSQHVSTKKQNTNSCFQRECGQTIEWIILSITRQMREKLSMCALLPDKCLTKTPKKNTKKTFDKLSFTKVTKDIYVKSRQFFLSIKIHTCCIKPWSWIEKFELTTHLSKGSVN